MAELWAERGVELGTEGREPPALPGHGSADRKASLVVLFLFFFPSPLLDAFPADTYFLHCPTHGISSVSAKDFVSMRY